MTADEERLAAAAEFGRQKALETEALMGSMFAQRDQAVLWLNNRDVARRHAQAMGGTEQDIHRLVFQAGNAPIERPRPRLVTAEG